MNRVIVLALVTASCSSTSAETSESGPISTDAGIDATREPRPVRIVDAAAANASDARLETTNQPIESLDDVSGLSRVGPEGPSCSGEIRRCGPSSCCASLLVPGGTFQMGRSKAGGTDACQVVEYCDGDEYPEHPAKVASFYLDLFEVNVGRFRRFVEAFDGKPPAPGAGAHALIAGSGWDPAWENDLLHRIPKSREELVRTIKCSDLHTWRDKPDVTDLWPINCVGWDVAFMFCAWDGGRLPTEAEWEYAAAGGIQNRLYPWGQDKPTQEHVVRGFEQPLFPVGTFPAGAGRWGHLDLAGNAFEWVLDILHEYPARCDNCAFLGPKRPSGWDHVMRGGSVTGGLLDTTARAAGMFSFGSIDTGFRCARSATLGNQQ